MQIDFMRIVKKLHELEISKKMNFFMAFLLLEFIPQTVVKLKLLKMIRFAKFTRSKAEKILIY